MSEQPPDQPPEPPAEPTLEQQLEQVTAMLNRVGKSLIDSQTTFRAAGTLLREITRLARTSNAACQEIPFHVQVRMTPIEARTLLAALFELQLRTQ